MIPMIQFVDHRKLKEKENQSVNASVLLRMETKIIIEGRVRERLGRERRKRGKWSRIRCGRR